MIAKWIKNRLKHATISLTYSEGDMVTIVLTYKEVIIFDRTFDIMKKH